ncbi:MAG: peptidylprolyl isomerase [Methylomicrobium sp.]|nr:peptidylprolyl isomerase [Methylomicrobium sp.]
MNKRIIPLLLAGSGLLAACDAQQQASAPAAPAVNKADAVAEVNGQYISKSALANLESEIAERSQGQTFPKDKLVEELVQRELLVQEALKKQLDKSPEIVEKLEQAKRSLLAQAALQDYLKAKPITDEEMKAEYDKNVGGANSMEYKASHILVKTKEEAEKLIQELDKGANFKELAKKNSTDPAGAEGGDLGWFVQTQMVPPFSEAVVALENGKYTKTPIETQFGWHVILREDARAQAVPPLEAVKEQLVPFLQRQRIQTMLETLRSQAKVEILLPKEAPKAEPAPALAPPAESASPEQAAPPADTAAPEAAKPAEPTHAADAAKPAETEAPKPAEPDAAPAPQPAEAGEAKQ